MPLACIVPRIQHRRAMSVHSPVGLLESGTDDFDRTLHIASAACGAMDAIRRVNPQDGLYLHL